MNRVRALAAAVLTIVAVSVGPAAAQEPCAGVTVLVEPGPDTETSITCVEQPTSGLDALTDAGHDVTFVPGMPGLVCTIDGHPDPCNGAPTGAYWSYWWAEDDGPWEYATRGAADRTPPDGAVEGWRFGAGDPPVTAPATARTTDRRGVGPADDTARSERTLPTLAAIAVAALLGMAAWRRGRRP